MIQGKLTLREVGLKAIDVNFSQNDEWVQSALKIAAPHEDISGLPAAEWAKNSKITGSLTAERIDPEYTVYGSFEARVPLLCPRCGVEGSVAREGTFRLFLKPVGPYETVEESDDPDYVFLETPEIDLVQLLSEQIVSVEAVVEYPDLELSGKTHSCEAISGQIDGNARNSPFAALGQLKDIKTKNLKK